MGLRRLYQDYQEIFLAFYALVIIGGILVAYGYGIFAMVEVTAQATRIDKSAGQSVEFKLIEARTVLEKRSALQSN